MSYDINDGTGYGYDQLFTQPIAGTYNDYNIESNNKYDKNVIRNLHAAENESRYHGKKYNNVYDYLEQSARGTNALRSFNPEIEELKKKLIEFQHKNDILLIFLVYLILIIMYQYNMGNSASNMYYGPTYARPN